ncbi:MAG: (2,3-dihydroxybenzoyl)adenylate synthase [Lachnospiraceae bacterium]
MKSKSLQPYCSLEYFEAISLGQAVDIWAQAYGDKIAIKDEYERISYRELAEGSDRYAHRLEDMGIRAGDIVIMQSLNQACYVRLMFGLFKVGAVPVLVLPAYRESEIKKILDKTDAIAYIAPREYMGVQYGSIADGLRQEKETLKCILVDESWATECDNYQEKDELDRRAEFDDVAVLLLSGGTTGDPKLIPRTHADYLYNAKLSAIRSRMDGNTVYLAALSIAHNMPLSSPGILGAFTAGGTVVMCPFPSPDEILALIEEERVTITGLVPTVAGLCTDLLKYDSFDISSLQTVILGGSRVDAKLVETVMREWGCMVQNQFGTAEGLITVTSLDDSADCIGRCQGKPISAADQVRILGDDGSCLVAGEIGELVVKGPYTIESYYKEPGNELKFTSDGFYRTGDKAMIGLDGNLYVLGRMKEQINRAGEKITPAEIEDALMAIDGILEAVVISVADDRLGQRSCAFVKPEGKFVVDKSEIARQMIKNGVAQYKVPDQIEVIETWPVTKMGKVDYEKLRERVSAID